MRSGADEAVRFVLDIEAFGDTAPHVEGLAILGPVTDWGKALAALA